MKKVNESLTKNPANLDDIVNNVDQMDTLLNSREFLTTLINDLMNSKRNVVEWKLVDENNGADRIDPEGLTDSFNVEYSFDFKYNYITAEERKQHEKTNQELRRRGQPEKLFPKGEIIPLTMYINGSVSFARGEVRPGNHFTPPEGGEMNIDMNHLGDNLDLSLFDKDGDELNLKWLTPELEKKVTQSILKDYV